MSEHGEEIKKLCTEGGKTLFWSSNFSLGVAIFSAVNKYLAKIMNQFPAYDVTMSETHHILSLIHILIRVYWNAALDVNLSRNDLKYSPDCAISFFALALELLPQEIKDTHNSNTLANRQHTNLSLIHIYGFDAVLNVCQQPLIYNGDINCPDDVHRIRQQFPALAGVMIGRGLLANPALALEYKENRTLTPDEMKEKLHIMHTSVYKDVYKRQAQNKPSCT